MPTDYWSSALLFSGKSGRRNWHTGLGSMLRYVTRPTSSRLWKNTTSGLLTGLPQSHRYRDYVPPVFAGGLLGILAMIVWGSWMALRPFYTDEHVSSTTAIAFVIIPIYAVGTGAVGAALSASLYTPFRYVIRRRRQSHRVRPDGAGEGGGAADVAE